MECLLQFLIYDERFMGELCQDEVGSPGKECEHTSCVNWFHLFVCCLPVDTYVKSSYIML